MPTQLSTRSLTLRRAVFATGIQTDQRLIHLKAVLEENGIRDISTLGRLQLGLGDVRLKLTRPICAFSSSLCGLKLVSVKWRCLVPPTSTPKGYSAHR